MATPVALSTNVQTETLDLSRLVDPRSIAVIGASDRPNSLGARSVANLLDHSDFQGTPYLISRTKQSIHGLDCYQSVTDLPEAPDVAMLVVPAAQTLQVLEDCAGRGVRYAIVFTSGFGEMGEEGKRAEQEMARIGRESGMRIYGPNSPGLCNLNKRLGMMFSPSFQIDQLPGPIGLATQGGGIGRCFLQAMERGVGVGLWASTGNEVDLTVADFMRYMADADDIEVIATTMEGIKDGPKFVEAALYAAERGKPVVALKVGRSEYGARAVASHTGSLSGAAEVNSAVLRQAGVVEVDDMDELIDTAALFARKRPTGGERVAIYGFSGGGCALTADAVGEAGLELTAFSEQTLAAIGSVLPDYAAITNPVDATSDILARPEIGHESLKQVAEDPGAGVVLYPFPCDYGELTGQIGESIAQVQRETDTPIVPIWMSDRLGEGYDALVKGGLVPVRSIKRGTKALSRWIERGRWSVDPDWSPLPAGRTGGDLVTFTEPAVKSFLASHGVTVPPSGRADTADKAVDVAENLGYPVVMKIVNSQITHKSDMGGVEVNLRSAADVRLAFDRIAAAAVAAGVTTDEVLVESMAPAGIDVLVGVTADPVFGPVMTFGLGGIFVELFNDVSRRMLPLTPAQARSLIDEPKCAALLRGLRGSGPADVEALADLMVAVSRFVETNSGRIEELELNPVRVLPAGQGVIALDAVLVMNETNGDAL
ncbi:acetate--CoA ligase family protein [Arthrobacter sp. I2-34]|uniref:Acetate--CoA ligase family protein n=1 Tax=Arthrobacter hankyongi TaxID=2904801 RepID=A0ABS9L4B4_9MICC|nr:acetate--CoA ligase family protein [Arthrobacter hankyongi]MCG2621337.1 acetate--CoA ligase family protein [Arthrobacter hankyongi]